MKLVFTFLIAFLCYYTAFAQLDNMIDDPGDIAFVAYETDPVDGYAFVFLDNCPDGTVIKFIDEEWLGAAWSSATGEGENTWTNNTGGQINAGTVIIVQNPQSPTVNIGSITLSDSGFIIAPGDQITAIVGNRDPSAIFLAVVGEFDCCSDNHTLTGMGLTNGTHAIQISNEGHYAGSTECNGTHVQCLMMINNPANWNNTGTWPDNVPSNFSGSLLPVELVSFTGRIKGIESVELDWVTASEINNKGFSIEHSIDQKLMEWNSIGFVDGAGSGTFFETKKYQFTHNNLSPGVNYYRLKQIDFDDNFEYSSVIALRMKEASISSSFAPNPAIAGQTQLSITTIESGVLQLRAFNVAGRELLVQTLSVQEGVNKFDLNLSELGSGIFFMEMELGRSTFYKKIIVNNQ